MSQDTVTSLRDEFSPNHSNAAGSYSTENTVISVFLMTALPGILKASLDGASCAVSFYCK
jgi:hypothetical protein